MMDNLRVALTRIRDADGQPTWAKPHPEPGMPSVIRVAAHAALLLYQKYHNLIDIENCEVYTFAIGAHF